MPFKEFKIRTLATLVIGKESNKVQLSVGTTLFDLHEWHTFAKNTHLYLRKNERCRFLFGCFFSVLKIQQGDDLVLWFPFDSGFELHLKTETEPWTQFQHILFCVPFVVM